MADTYFLDIQPPWHFTDFSILSRIKTSNSISERKLREERSERERERERERVAKGG